MRPRGWILSLWGLIAVVLIAPVAARADITVQATINAERVAVGESLTLVIEANGAQDVPAPTLDIDGFDGRYVGPSTQISIVNGQMSASVQHRYSLLPMRPGHFTLGPFTIEYQGKRYQTAPLTVDVTPAGQAPAGAPPQAGGPAASGTAQGRALYLTLSAQPAEVYLHQRLPIDITLYVGAVRAGDVQYPSLPAEGLSVDKFSQPTQRQQVIDGQQYQVVHFQTTAVPLRAGSLTVGPATLRLNVYDQRQRGAFNDPFFDSFFQQARPVDLHSDPITVNVLPLPDAGKPAGFSGAVGSFTMQVTAAPTQVTAGDPITVQMKITGSGNLSDAAAPLLTSTAGFRIYDARPTKSDDAGKSFEQVLIPNDSGVHAIPPVRFSYFDPQARRYQTVESRPIALVVRPPQQAPKAEIFAGGAPAGTHAEEKLGRDIVYIKDDPGTLAPRGQPWSHHLLLLLWQPVPLLLFAGAWWYDQRRQRLSGDVRYARFTRAGKDARRGLAAAEHALAAGNRQEFYDAVSRTMQAYLTAKLDLPPGAIDAETVGRCALPAECAEQVRSFFATCEQIRFAPAGGDGDMRGTLALAHAIMKRLERGQRYNPAGRAAAAAVAISLVALTTATGRAAPPPISPQTTFFHANALYKDGQYDAAVREYEQLLHAGLESGNLYFNLANAYFKAGEKGRAILNYERALRLQPGDPDVQANLAYAQSLSGAEPCPPPLWQRLVFPLAHRTSTQRLLWATSACYSFLFFGLTAYRLSPQRPRWLVYGGVGLAIVAALAVGSLAHQVIADDAHGQAVVISEGDTPARFEPAENGTVHFVLKEGTRLRVLEQREGWVQVARCDGRRGWVRKASIEGLQIAD